MARIGDHPNIHAVAKQPVRLLSRSDESDHRPGVSSSVMPSWPPSPLCFCRFIAGSTSSTAHTACCVVDGGCRRAWVHGGAGPVNIARDAIDVALRCPRTTCAAACEEKERAHAWVGVCVRVCMCGCNRVLLFQFVSKEQKTETRCTCMASWQKSLLPHQ